jgi:hypothetical protein
MKIYGGVVSFTPRPLYRRGKSPRCPVCRRLVGPQSRPERLEKENLLPLPGIEPRPSSLWAAAVSAQAMNEYPKIHLNSTSKKTLLHYQGQPINAAQGNCRCVREPYETHEHCVGIMQSY